MEQTQNKKMSLFSLIVLLAMIFGFAFSVPVAAYAASAETDKTQADTIIEQSFFFGWRKGENDSRGRYIVAMFYVPDEVYDSECTYGVALFPKRYMEKFNVYDNYLTAFAEQNVAILNVIGSNAQEAPEGKVFRIGITNIMEKNMSLDFTFVFYATDRDGNTAYLLPQFAAYNTLSAKEMTDEEILTLLEQQKGMKENFGQITGKLSDLVDSVWLYLVIAAGSVVLVWGAYIGIRVAIAKKNDEKNNAKDMIKRLIIGIIIAFVLAGGLPLLVKGLAAWIGG